MRLIGTFIALALAGCSTGVVLTDEGTQVQNVSDVDMPTGCNLLGDVRIGIPPDAAMPGSRDELAILLRNKAGAMGGTHVVLEQAEERERSNGEPSFRGRGRAYACPEETRGPPEETGGGEAPAEEGDDEGGGLMTDEDADLL